MPEGLSMLRCCEDFRRHMRPAGMVRVMDGPHTGPFNIGNPTEFTMLELAQVVKEVVNPKAQITYKENTADDPTRRKPDITKVRHRAMSPPRLSCAVLSALCSGPPPADRCVPPSCSCCHVTLPSQSLL